MIIGISSRKLNNIDNKYIVGYKSIIDIINNYKGNTILLVDGYDLNSVLDKCDGFILPGGDLYNILDKKVVEYAIKFNKPILGICLGMQMMASKDEENIVSIGTTNHLKPLKKYVHEVIIDCNSKLFNILNKEKIITNSRHKDTVKNSGMYNVVGNSDNIIEVIEYSENDFNIGVQWHPEDMIEYDLDSKKIFDEFFKVCIK